MSDKSVNTENIVTNVAAIQAESCPSTPDQQSSSNDVTKIQRDLLLEVRRYGLYNIIIQ